jgi:flagellar protein FliO/FliZ
MDVLGLAVRVGVSLACVLGLLWLLSRGLQRGTGARGISSDRVRVLSRVSLGRSSGLAVVRVGERALVLGVADGRVNLLSEMPLTDVADAATTAEERREVDLTGGGDPIPPVPAARAGGPLAGSALSPATWSLALEALRDRTTRR